MSGNGTKRFNANKFHDISRLPSHGYLVLPLSMSKLHGEQSPEEIYRFLKVFDPKVPVISIDVIVLYTNGLYFNSEEAASSLRKKSTAQMINHSRALMSMIAKKREYIPQAFHFLPWDYVILNAPEFGKFLSLIQCQYLTNPDFKEVVRRDLSVRGLTDANVQFVLEELVVTHLVRQKYIPFPSFLTHHDGWRLICYPGPTLESDVFVYQNELLPLNNTVKESDKFARSMYNWKDTILMDFTQMNLISSSGLKKLASI